MPILVITGNFRRHRTRFVESLGSDYAFNIQKWNDLGAVRPNREIRTEEIVMRLTKFSAR